MPSNKDLTDAIIKLDAKAVVDGLTNQGLEALLSSLKPASVPPTASALSDAAKFAADEAKAEAEAKAKAEKEAKAQAAANAAAEAAVKGDSTHRLAEGKAVTTLRGIVAFDESESVGGGRVSARDFSLGKADLDRLLADGVLVKL